MGLDLVNDDGHDTGKCIEAAREAGFGRNQEPALGSQQHFGVGAVRMQSQPTLDAPGFLHPAELHRVRRQNGWFEAGQVSHD